MSRWGRSALQRSFEALALLQTSQSHPALAQGKVQRSISPGLPLLLQLPVLQGLQTPIRGAGSASAEGQEEGDER